MPRGGSNLSSFLFSAELENIGHVSYSYYELKFPSYSRLPKEGLLISGALRFKEITLFIASTRELIIARKQVDEHVVPSKTVTNQ
ncbi:hypothetical protein P5673_014033 [Acropora cervicornis]|uniref:Uncharacterized protein n=1 Tax=Acropora cervicornis TaxID=6130 RepID=A0AAD9V6N6_ACRCE|nr:hypothetical protein P5673_014033 [Acropora cervicornis]